MFQLAVVARQPRAPCQERRVSTTAGPSRRATCTGRPKARGRVGRAEPRPDRPGEPRVVHRAVPAVAVHVAGSVVVVLADGEGIVAERLRRAAYGASHLVGHVERPEPAGHVGDVDAPAVDVVRRLQPAPHDRVGALDHRGPQVGVAVVDLGQRVVAHPGGVGAVVVEVVVRPRRRQWIGPRAEEPLVGVARVVGRQVAEDPPAACVHGAAQAFVGRIAAEQRVDLVEGGRVVAVVALAGEDRGRVDDVAPTRSTWSRWSVMPSRSPP